MGSTKHVSRAAHKRARERAPRDRSLAERCPTCAHRLSAEHVCWHCCDRLCRACRRLTGSAFVDICWSCWFRRERTGE